MAEPGPENKPKLSQSTGVPKIEDIFASAWGLHMNMDDDEEQQDQGTSKTSREGVPPLRKQTEQTRPVPQAQSSGEERLVEREGPLQARRDVPQSVMDTKLVPTRTQSQRVPRITQATRPPSRTLRRASIVSRASSFRRVPPPPPRREEPSSALSASYTLEPPYRSRQQQRPPSRWLDPSVSQDVLEEFERLLGESDRLNHEMFEAFRERDARTLAGAARDELYGIDLELTKLRQEASAAHDVHVWYDRVYGPQDEDDVEEEEEENAIGVEERERTRTSYRRLRR